MTDARALISPPRRQPPMPPTPHGKIAPSPRPVCAITISPSPVPPFDACRPPMPPLPMLMRAATPPCHADIITARCLMPLMFAHARHHFTPLPALPRHFSSISFGSSPPITDRHNYIRHYHAEDDRENMRRNITDIRFDTPQQGGGGGGGE